MKVGLYKGRQTYNTLHLESNTSIFNKLPNTDQLTTGNFNEKNLVSTVNAVYKQVYDKKLNDSSQFVKFKCSLNFPGLQLNFPGLQLNFPGLQLNFPGLQLNFPVPGLQYRLLLGLCEI